MRSDFYIDFNYRCHSGRCSSTDKVTAIVHARFSHTSLCLPIYVCNFARIAISVRNNGVEEEKKKGKKKKYPLRFDSVEIRMIIFFQEA